VASSRVSSEEVTGISILRFPDPESCPRNSAYPSPNTSNGLAVFALPRLWLDHAPDSYIQESRPPCPETIGLANGP